MFSWTIRFLQINVFQFSAWELFSCSANRYKKVVGKSTIHCTDFHLISPFSAVCLILTFRYGCCSKSGSSEIQILKRFNFLSGLSLGSSVAA